MNYETSSQPEVQTKKKKKKAKSCGKLGIPTGLWYIIYNHNKYRFEN